MKIDRRLAVTVSYAAALLGLIGGTAWYAYRGVSDRYVYAGLGVLPGRLLFRERV